MKQLQAVVLAAALAGASRASASLTVIIDSPNPSQIVNLLVSPVGGSLVPSFSGGVYAGIYNETINGVFTPSFCIDVAHDVYVGEQFTDYSYAALADAPDTPAGPMGAPTAIAIEKLWAKYFTAAQADNSGVTAAALQVAIWEAEGGGQLLGNGSPGYTVTESDGAGVSALVATMLGALPSLTAEADLVAIVSPDGQSYVVAVPEATTVIAGTLLLLPLGASTLRILRRQRV
ncbi:MAG: hypothetical protein ABSF51_13535 [Verrucomicrobiota bacterium]|jgi:hypothetical protein